MVHGEGVPLYGRCQFTRDLLASPRAKDFEQCHRAARISERPNAITTRCVRIRAVSVDRAKDDRLRSGIGRTL